MNLSLAKQTLVDKFNFLGSPINKCLVAFTAFAFAMLAFRLFYSGKLMFVFLVWNLFLAYLPYLISTVMERKSVKETSWYVFSVLFIAWLLLIPNSFYIITDLFHLKERYPIPLWFDLSLIFSFAWTGMLLGILSLRQMEAIIQQRWKLRTTAVFVLPVMFLISIGIYIGRFLRYNSWDVITNPFSLAKDIIDLCIHPFQNRFDWSMIVCFSMLFTLFYISTNYLDRNPRTLKVG